MGAPITAAQMQRFFDKRIGEVIEENKKFDEHANMIPKLFRMMSSKNLSEEFQAMGAVPNIPDFNGKLSTLSVAPGFHKRIEPSEKAGKLVIERKFLDAQLWNLFTDSGRDLKKAANRTKEEDAVKIFANSTSTAFDYMTSEEGVALASNSHATKSGTSTATGFDNSGTSAFSKTAVAATWIIMHQFRNDISKQINPAGKFGLVVPFNLVDAAMELVGTPKGFDTAALDMNAQGNGRYEVIPYPLLDDYDTNDWHMVDMSGMKKDLVWIDRVKDDITTHVDFQTYMTEIAIYYSSGYGFLDWRWIFSHTVS